MAETKDICVSSPMHITKGYLTPKFNKRPTYSRIRVHYCSVSVRNLQRITENYLKLQEIWRWCWRKANFNYSEDGTSIQWHPEMVSHNVIVKFRNNLK